jgi:hypothetical protein
MFCAGETTEKTYKIWQFGSVICTARMVIMYYGNVDALIKPLQFEN